MAGTNARRFKRALIDKIAGFESLTDVQVEYSWPGARFERECVHGGRVEGTQAYATFGGGQTRLPRNENLVVRLYVVVRMPGADDGDEVETRATEIGELIENGLAADPKVAAGNIPGALYAGVSGFELDSDADDDAWSAVLEYQITLRSRLR